MEPVTSPPDSHLMKRLIRPLLGVILLASVATGCTVEIGTACTQIRGQAQVCK